MAKKKYTTTKMEASKPKGTGATRLKFDNKPSIWPADEAKTSKNNIDKSLFSEDALGAEIGPSAEYAAKSKKGFYMESCFDHKMPNTMSPTSDY